MYTPQKARLPETQLGSERCLQLEYFGHGDIFMATWDGPIGYKPSANDGTSTCFGLAHSNDVIMLAACVGFLRRVKTPEEKISKIIIDAGQIILEDSQYDTPTHDVTRRIGLDKIARGEELTRFNQAVGPLSCLVDPRPVRPGVLSTTGGTGIYTKPTSNGADSLVYASFLPNQTEIYKTANFCAEDIPVMARLICNNSMGEYRTEILRFIDEQFSDKT